MKTLTRFTFESVKRSLDSIDADARGFTLTASDLRLCSLAADSFEADRFAKRALSFLNRTGRESIFVGKLPQLVKPDYTVAPDRLPKRARKRAPRGCAVSA